MQTPGNDAGILSERVHPESPPVARWSLPILPDGQISDRSIQPSRQKIRFPAR
jgi:hypothetical protein